MSGAPSNNKGWKSRFFFVSAFRGWGFSLKWMGHDVDNVPPFLSKDEAEQVSRLRGILSSSKAIRSMDEDWLVVAGLSSAPRGMVLSVPPVAWSSSCLCVNIDGSFVFASMKEMFIG